MENMKQKIKSDEKVQINEKNNDISKNSKSIIMEDKDKTEKCLIKVWSISKILTLTHITNISKSICELRLETEDKTLSGMGFLLKFDIAQEYFYFLVSNESVIKKDIIDNNKLIYLYFDNEPKSFNLKLDGKKR